MIPDLIRLHNAANNSVVVINIEKIAVLDTQSYEGRMVSEIYLTTDADCENFMVNESPEKIYDMIDNLKQNK